MKRILIKSFLLSIFLEISQFVFFLNMGFMGVSNKDIAELFLKKYGTFIALYSLKIFLYYFLINTILFLIAELERKNSLLNELWLIFIFYFSTFSLAIIKYPQMFTNSFYLKGGILKQIQLFYDNLSPEILWVVLSAVIIFTIIKSRSYLSYSLLFLFIFSILYMPEEKSIKIKTSNIKDGSILILASDSLRPDHLSFYGYKRETPNIDFLLKNSINFFNTYSSLARTFPSWVSILTSSFPFQHGIRHMFPDFIDRSEKFYTLVSFLKDKGYFTAVISDFSGDIFPRIDLGFDEVYAPRFTAKTLIKLSIIESQKFSLGTILTPIGRKAFPVLFEEAMNPEPYYLTERAKKLIKKAIKKKKPFFIVVFYSTNHSPYAPKYPYYKIYRKKDYRGKHLFKVETLIEAIKDEKISKEDKEQIVSLYDGGVKLFDHQVGKIVKFLKNSNIINKTIIVLLSDHGENLFEKSLGMGHGDHILLPYSNRMVFSIFSKKRNFKGHIIYKTVRDIDIAPTILNVSGFKKPDFMKGIDLIKSLSQNSLVNLPCYLETGLWYKPEIPRIKESKRIFYPGIKELLTVDELTDELILKRRYREIVIQAKHRAIIRGAHKLVFIPLRGNVKTIFTSPYKGKWRRIVRNSLNKQFINFFKEKEFYLNKNFVYEK